MKRDHSAGGSKEGIFTPLSRFPQGKAGAGGFPPRRKNRGSPRKRASPLARSPKRTRERFCLTEEGLLMETLMGREPVSAAAACAYVFIRTIKYIPPSEKITSGAQAAMTAGN